MFHNKFLGQFASDRQSRSLDDSDYPTARFKIARKLISCALEILSILRLFCDVREIKDSTRVLFCRRVVRHIEQLEDILLANS